EIVVVILLLDSSWAHLDLGQMMNLHLTENQGLNNLESPILYLLLIKAIYLLTERFKHIV
ncbi:hypothetical protein ACJX0J_011007, partial [Zea mays]